MSLSHQWWALVVASLAEPPSNATHHAVRPAVEVVKCSSHPWWWDNPNLASPCHLCPWLDLQCLSRLPVFHRQWAEQVSALGSARAPARHRVSSLAAEDSRTRWLDKEATKNDMNEKKWKRTEIICITDVRPYCIYSWTLKLILTCSSTLTDRKWKYTGTTHS